ncbi:MAG: hypothetical protein IPG99_17115 [Ignavibacteria bacterium]|nr:hypothetical protein [Ignavibacteria bacterium]
MNNPCSVEVWRRETEILSGSGLRVLGYAAKIMDEFDQYFEAKELETELMFLDRWE